MITSWRIGAATVTALSEYYGPVHVPDRLFPDLDRAVLREHRDLLEGRFWYEAIDRLVISVTLWIVTLAGRTILIDTGIGNGKTRRTPRANMMNTVVPDWLAAAGAAPDQVTDVVMTHLHADHVGWNTVRDGDHWVPTFPGATYHVPRADFEHWAEIDRRGEAVDGGSFRDSVLPVLEAGLVRWTQAGDRVADTLDAVSARGHTPGQLAMWLRSEGRAAVFCGDILHHPVHVLRPEWNSVVDVEPDHAAATRQAFLAEVADRDVLVAPCHFAPPHAAFVRREADGYVFDPIGNGTALPAHARPAQGASARKDLSASEKAI
ncbi:MBL fold metallo-hydrolase [Aurantimonas sp. MSK8Z-1]|uniref:MBL fold metallo-hydrolase n=1 Tax=Mangrovibrevibacter kandeliae TaxID=2968473 RepID=UPI002117FD03|nr:MBL fold metallo-hydrolase [Aurantimonas sp. MSK8Z-1]MCW4115450.1 MBL fold metallo-hydrolase [Aurantimonas sp. MSK8Z-1]